MLRLFNTRLWNIVFRTAHLAAMGVLLGGHAFEVERQRLLPILFVTIGTGAALGLLETGGSLIWLHQGRGLMTLAKLALIAAIPSFWDYRLAILLAVVALASVGSHMPARFRYYSVLYREVLRCSAGPGTERLKEEDEDGACADN